MSQPLITPGEVEAWNEAVKAENARTVGPEACRCEHPNPGLLCYEAAHERLAVALAEIDFGSGGGGPTEPSCPGCNEHCEDDACSEKHGPCVDEL
jgi:hypothetical protein